MRQAFDYVIRGESFTVEQLGAREGSKVLARLTKVIAPVAAMASADAKTEDILAKLLDALTEEDLDYLTTVFAQATRVTLASGKVITLKDQFDEYFAGKYGLMLQWFYKCLDANFASFLAEFGIDLQSLSGEATKALQKVTTPTAPTG
jgi:hypothetical protein